MDRRLERTAERWLVATVLPLLPLLRAELPHSPLANAARRLVCFGTLLSTQLSRLRNGGKTKTNTPKPGPSCSGESESELAVILVPDKIVHSG